MAEVVVLTAEATVAFTVIREPVASAALSVVDVPVGHWTHERVDEQFIQEPILLGRQFEQGFPAFTQAHPLQVPVLCSGVVFLHVFISALLVYFCRSIPT